ncbi:MAG: hypothetical protein OQK04_20315 [Kangiellaceae bacterium]|nr:hypothetical protein [Kangiellaceae bacterium]MCW9001067.1 hypothetical protein [Kangiellaceae bacterium]
MDATYYFGIIVRLFAIILFLFGVEKLQPVFEFGIYADSMVGPSLVFSLISALAPILVAMFIWLFPLSVAKKLLPPTNEQVKAISSQSTLTVLILAIGVYTFYYAVVNSIYWITLAHVFVRDEYGGIVKSLSNQDKAHIFSTIIEFILSLVLIAKAKTISRKLSDFSK